ncbi:MAG: TAXI family TRAP transporter solute-binding subunit [Clostridia bacterium]|nr:TAXI family TRAP transporter solute-binding subunit [Clostridia bacterium]
MKKILTLALAVVMLCACMLSVTSCNPNAVTVTIKTGGTGGTYYAFTNAAAPMLGEKTGYTCTVLPSGGSVDSLKSIKVGDCNMAIVQNDTMVNAYNGLTDNFKDGAITNFSVLAHVYPEVVQIVCHGRNAGKINSLGDLKGSGLTVSIGDMGSGVEANAIALMQKYGLTFTKDAGGAWTSDDIKIRNLSVAKSADALKDDALDVFFFTSGAPATSITELAANGNPKNAYMLSLDDAVMEEFINENKIDGKFDVFAKQTITHAQYDFIPEGQSVKTIGVTATYIVSNDLSEEVVYNLTKALWESREALLSAHSISSNMNVERAFTTVGNVPVHPGAAKYYRELGQTVENVADLSK